VFVAIGLNGLLFGTGGAFQSVRLAHAGPDRLAGRSPSSAASPAASGSPSASGSPACLGFAGRRIARPSGLRIGAIGAVGVALALARAL
jgi:hypothetical protein